MHQWKPRSAVALLLLLLLLTTGAPVASAYDFRVLSRTEGYGYQLRRLDRDGVTFLNRRRLTQYLGLSIFNLLEDGERPTGSRGQRAPALLYLHTMMRFDTDFGGFQHPAAAVPELENNELDLMLGALEGRNLLRGYLDFTLGRQYDTEQMDFFAYDGLRVRVNLPRSLFAEVHLGVQVSRAQPFSAALLQVDGGPLDEPSTTALSPTFGAAIGYEDPGTSWLRMSYRGTASMASPVTARDQVAALPEIWGVDQEAIYVGAGFKVPVVGTRPQIHLRHDLLTAQISDLQAIVTQPMGAHNQLQLEFLRSRPHFDGDSIFHLFSSEPFNELCGRYALSLLQRRLELYLRGGYRRYWHDDDGNDNEADASPALSGAIGARFRDGSLRATADLFFLGGLGAETLGGDAWATWAVARWLALEGRLSLISSGKRYDVDRLLNLGAQLGGSVRLWRGVAVHLLMEDNVSRLSNSALRVLAVLDLEFSP